MRILRKRPIDQNAYRSDMAHFIETAVSSMPEGKRKKYCSDIDKTQKMADFIISIITISKHRGEADKALNATLLRNISHQMDFAKAFLVKKGYLKITQNYIKKKRCYHYALTDKFEEGLSYRSFSKDDRYALKFRHLLYNNIDEASKEWLERTLENLCIREEEAQEYVDKCRADGMDTDKVEGMQATIDCMKEGAYHSIDRFSGRSHTPLTNCASFMRNFFYFKGHKSENIASLDIANSQFVISTALFTDKGIEMLRKAGCSEEVIQMAWNIRNATDVKEYVELARNGGLYEYISEKSKNLKYATQRQQLSTREKAKSAMFHFNFAPSSNGRMGRAKYAKWTALKEIFPTVYSFIETLRTKNEAKFYPKLLQMLEVDVMIDGASKKLYDSGIRTFATIHDSILVPFSLKEEADRAIRESFMERFGFQPTVRMDVYGIDNIKK